MKRRANLVNTNDILRYLIKDKNIIRYNMNIIKQLNDLNITKFYNFIELFMQHGCRIADIIVFIVFFVQNYNTNNENQITFFSNRSFKQSKWYYKNNIVTLLVMQHEKEFIQAIIDFHSTYLPKITNIKSFIASINDLIQEIKNDQTISDITIDFDINTNEGFDLYDDFDFELNIFDL